MFFRPIYKTVFPVFLKRIFRVLPCRLQSRRPAGRPVKSDQVFGMKNLFLAIGFAMLVCGGATAVADEESAVDQFKTRTLSLAIKTCIKTYFLNSDFQSLKNENIAEINRKTEPQFNADYNQAWAVLRKCPDLVSKYRLRPNMTKQEVLKIVSRLTRNDCFEAVDSIPDEVIVDQFNNCMADPEIQNKPLNEQINLIMKRRITGKGG